MFGWSSFPKLHLISFSRKSLIRIYLVYPAVDEDNAYYICDLLRVNGRRFGALNFVFKLCPDAPTESVYKLIDEIDKSALSEVTFECLDEELYAHILTNACKMTRLESLCSLYPF
jgi:hypothetical protein